MTDKTIADYPVSVLRNSCTDYHGRKFPACRTHFADQAKAIEFLVTGGCAWWHDSDGKFKRVDSFGESSGTVYDGRDGRLIATYQNGTLVCGDRDDRKGRFVLLHSTEYQTHRQYAGSFDSIEDAKNAIDWGYSQDWDCHDSVLGADVASWNGYANPDDPDNWDDRLVNHVGADCVSPANFVDSDVCPSGNDHSLRLYRISSSRRAYHSGGPDEAVFVIAAGCPDRAAELVTAEFNGSHVVDDWEELSAWIIPTGCAGVVARVDCWD